ncbi:MAG: mucoidy inhibitor MuiA family protein [Spirochaetales bacterium]|nr:mucoidy inhibitor MuiA family protein [Spirochaetales bacterium]
MMRGSKALFLAAIACAGVLASAQEALAPSSRVAKVTVYSDRALVTRQAELALPKGESTVLFSNLPAALDPSSVQVSGTGAFTLRDVRVASRQLSRDVSAQLKALEDEKRRQEAMLGAVNDSIKEAEAERLFLAEMVKRLTSNAGDSEALPMDTAAWAKMLDFQRSRNEAINADLREARAKLPAIQAEIDRLAREIRALGSGVRLSVYEVELVLDAASAAKASIELSYLVAGPSWRPDYVLRANSADGSLSVQYRALVRQNTGEDWTNAAMQLSTARPQTGGSLPELYPWYVDVYQPRVLSKSSASRGAEEAPAPAAAAYMDLYAEQESAEPPMETATARADSGATAVLFSIAGTTTLASDNKERTLTVAMLNLSAAYSWAAVPKLSPYAYYRADVTNGSDYPFLAGPTHVYVDGSYVADADMPAVPTGGSFRCDLGIDEAVSVERELVKKFDETTGLVSKKSKTTWEYKLTVKNGNRRDVVVELSDQLPVSVNEQIVIKLLAPAYTKDTDTLTRDERGIFTWKLSLAPGKESSVTLSFSAEYPKDVEVTGLE